MLSSAYIVTQRLWFVVPSGWYINMNCIFVASGSTVLRLEVVIVIELLSGWAVIIVVIEGIQSVIPILSNINWYSIIHPEGIKSVILILSSRNSYAIIHIINFRVSLFQDYNSGIDNDKYRHLYSQEMKAETTFLYPPMIRSLIWWGECFSESKWCLRAPLDTNNDTKNHKSCDMCVLIIEFVVSLFLP